MELHGKYTLFAEGCRGHLGRRLQERFKLRDGADPQVYGIGLKELWEIKPEQHQKGLVMHTAGWPLEADTYGGSFFYHMEDNLVAVGFVVGLGYTNPYLNPYEEFQRYKTHPAIRSVSRRRQAHRIRRARDHRRRPAVAAEARVPGRLPDRRRRRLSQRLAHQGQPRRDEVGHARRRSRVAMRCRRGRAGDELTAYPERSARAGCTTSCTARATSSRS